MPTANKTPNDDANRKLSKLFETVGGRLSQSHVATLLSVARSTVSYWVKTGFPVNADGTIHLGRLVDWLIEREKAKSKPSGSAAEESERWLAQFRKARAQRERYELGVRRAKFVPVDDVIAIAGRILVAVTTSLKGLPNAAAALLRPNDPRGAKVILDQFVDDALCNLERLPAELEIDDFEYRETVRFVKEMKKTQRREQRQQTNGECEPIVDPEEVDAVDVDEMEGADE